MATSTSGGLLGNLSYNCKFESHSAKTRSTGKELEKITETECTQIGKKQKEVKERKEESRGEMLRITFWVTSIFRKLTEEDGPVEKTGACNCVY